MRGFRVRLALLALLLVPSPSRGADPLTYDVTIAPTGDAALDEALTDSATLISLKPAGAIGPFGLIARARTDAGRFAEVLGSFGYYKAHVAVAVDGTDISNVSLPERLAALPAEPAVTVKVTIERGPLFHLRKVTLEGAPPDSDLAPAIAPGAPAEAGPVLAERDRLLTAVQSQGYALAKMPPPRAVLDDPANALDVTYRIEPGQRVDLGPVTITGLQRMNEDFVRRRVTIAQGQQFDPAAIEATRAQLQELGVFSSVRAQLGTDPNAPTLDADGQLPIVIAVAERPLRTVRFQAGYSTDLGAQVAASWQHRNLFGNAESLLLSASFNAGGTAARAPGYNTRAELTLPDTGAIDQSVILGLGAFSQSLEAYDIRAVTADGRLERRLSPHWKVSAGLGFAEQYVTQQGVGRDYSLLAVPFSATYDSTDNLLNPTHGIRANATVTPTASVQAPRQTFTLAQISGATYIDVGRWWGTEGRSIIATRALIGQAAGATQFELPPDRRFYAGGSNTIRGYKYQSVGPQFSNHDPIGGTSVAAGSVELRQRIGESYGFAAFADAGQVNSGNSPLSGAWRVGVGVGARYYTSIGPIRLDFAIPTQRLPGGDAFEAYIGIGQAF